MPREAYLQGKLIKALEARGAYVTNICPDGVHTRAGTPDLICCYRGLYVAFEIKNAKHKDPYAHLRPEQRVHIAMILQAGGEVFAINSVAQAMEILDQIDKAYDGGE